MRNIVLVLTAVFYLLAPPAQATEANTPATVVASPVIPELQQVIKYFRGKQRPLRFASFFDSSNGQASGVYWILLPDRNRRCSIQWWGWVRDDGIRIECVYSDLSVEVASINTDGSFLYVAQGRNWEEMERSAPISNVDWGSGTALTFVRVLQNAHDAYKPRTERR